MTTTLMIEGDITHLSLCLDFANTAVWHASERPIEKLNHYTDLITWASAVNLLNEEQAQHLNELAAKEPAQAANSLEKAIEVREVIYKIVVDWVSGRSPATDNLATFNTALAQSLSKSQLIPTVDGFTWSWQGRGLALDSMIWPVVRSAAHLLTTPEALARVGQCADDRGCGYLFIDVSKNRSRRWCDINDCGNRAKQRRYYRRQQKTNQS